MTFVTIICCDVKLIADRIHLIFPDENVCTSSADYGYDMDTGVLIRPCLWIDWRNAYAAAYEYYLFQILNVRWFAKWSHNIRSVSYTHLRAHETRHDLVCRLLLEKKKK